MSQKQENGILKYDSVIQHVIRGIRLGIYPDQSKIPSEKEFAAELGVSVTSVREGLKQLCARNIILKQQGRRSIVNAAALSGERRTLHIGWIGRSSFEQMNPVYFETYSRVLSLLMRTDCHLTFLPFRTERDEANILRIFDSFDGFLLAGIRPQYLCSELDSRLRNLRCVIELDDIGVSPARWNICTDNYAGGVMIGEFLLERKRRCPALFLSDWAEMYPGFNLRNRGVIDGLASRRVPFVLVPGGDRERNPSEFAGHIAELLKKYPEIDTIWHPQDKEAIAIRKIFEQIAPRKPGYYRSCGMDGLPETLEAEPYHASAAHPYGELARLAVETMLNLLTGSTTPSMECLRIPPELIPWK